MALSTARQFAHEATDRKGRVCGHTLSYAQAAAALYAIVVVAGALPTGWLCIVGPSPFHCPALRPDRHSRHGHGMPAHPAALTVAFLGPVGYSMRFVDIDKVITLAEQKINAAVAVYALSPLPSARLPSHSTRCSPNDRLCSFRVGNRAAAKARPVLQRLPFVKPKAE